MWGDVRLISIQLPVDIFESKRMWFLGHALREYGVNADRIQTGKRVGLYMRVPQCCACNEGLVNGGEYLAYNTHVDVVYPVRDESVCTRVKAEVINQTTAGLGERQP